MGKGLLGLWLVILITSLLLAAVVRPRRVLMWSKNSGRPDVEHKRYPILSKVAQKVATVTFYFKSATFIWRPKSRTFWAIVFVRKVQISALLKPAQKLNLKNVFTFLGHRNAFKMLEKCFPKSYLLLDKDQAGPTSCSYHFKRKNILRAKNADNRSVTVPAVSKQF